MHPATLNIKRLCAHTIVQDFSFGVKVRKVVTHLNVCVHGIVDGAKATIDTTARALSGEEVEIFVLIDRVQAFAHRLTTKFVLCAKAVVGLTAKPDDAVPLPFLLEESPCSH